ncbi:MAG: hypothetical protein ACT4PN_08225 [Nitrospiraceae bacterium]
MGKRMAIVRRESVMPLYSLVVFGRNDNYNPDFLYRLQTTLNFNARALQKAGLLREVEFVVVDWGSAVPLREVLVLDEAVASSTTFLELSPHAAGQFAGPSGIHVSRAANVGIRRANGRFVGMQGADLLMSSSSWQSLLSVLEDQCQSIVDFSKSCLVIPRRQVPWSFVARQPSLDMWELKLLTCDKATTEYEGSSPSTVGGMGVVVLHRDIWKEAKGLEESFDGYGYSDVDLGFRVGLHYPWIDAASYGVVCYKMQHDPEGPRGRLLKGGTIQINAPWITFGISSRQEDWGLPHVTIVPKKATPKIEQQDSHSASRWSGRFSDIPPSDPVLFAQPDVQKHASAALGRMQDFDEKHWELLTVLSWFALRRFPMNYLEVGLSHGRYVQAVSTASPSVDIYVLESVREDSIGHAPFSTKVAMSLLWQWGHKGYFRPLIGEPAVTLEQLAKSFIGPFEIELAVLNLHSDREIEVLPRLLSLVVPGGLLAVWSERVELLTAALEISGPLIKGNSSLYVGCSRCTAFIFVQDRRAESTQSIASNATHRRLPSTGLLTMLRLRTTVLLRQLQLAAIRLGHVSRWRAYIRTIATRMSLGR